MGSALLVGRAFPIHQASRFTERNNEVIMRRLLLAVPCVVVAMFASVAPALADTSSTQDLPPGGTISTGSSVSADDPIQLSVTAPAGGTFTLTKVTTAASRANFPMEALTFAGPQFQLTYTPPQGCTPNNSCGSQAAFNQEQQEAGQTLTATFLIDKSIMPRSGNDAAKYPYRYAAAWVCHTELVGSAPQSQSSCESAGETGTPDTTGQDLSDGNALVNEPVRNDILLQADGNSARFDIGHPVWRVDVYSRGKSDIDTGVRTAVHCILACTQDYTISISPAVEKKLHLHSTTVGHAVEGPAVDWRALHIPLSGAFKRAMSNYHEVRVTVRAVATGEEGERWAKSWQQEVAGGSELS